MITLTREEAQELLNALTMFCRPNEDQVDELVYEGAIDLLRARLSAPEPEPVARTCTRCQGKGRIYMGCDEWIHCSTCNETGVVHTPQLREKNT
jgi:hypothetical protein